MEIFKSSNGELYRVLEHSVCPKHGDYVSRLVHWEGTTKDGINVFGIPQTVNCPACVEDDKMVRLYGQTAIPPRFRGKRFEDYVATCPSQKKALAALMAYADNLAQNISCGRSAILTGRPGTGKTHLACALAARAQSEGYSALFTSVAKIVRNIRATWGGNGSEQAAIDAYVAVDLLIIDEVGVQVGSENEQQLLFAVLNERYEQMRPTFLLSNLTTKGVEKVIGERAMDRLRENGGIPISFDWESYRTEAVTRSLPERKNTPFKTEEVADNAVHPKGFGSAFERIAPPF